MQLLMETLHAVVGLNPAADALSGTKTGDWLNMKFYQKLLAVLLLGDATGGTATHTVTVQAASDASGSNAEAIPFTYRRVANTASSDVPGAVTQATASGFVTNAGDNQLYQIEIDAADLPDGKPFVAVKSVEATDDPVVAALVYVLGAARYPGAAPLTAIA
ncbi:MAG: hypothetical protein ABW189_01410 [Rickettsiales bacterium]